MKNVLVFPCGSEIGLEIYRSVAYSSHFRVFGGSSVDDHGRYVYEHYIPNIPDVNDEKFVELLNETVVTNKIDFILPAHDSVVLKLAEAKDKNLLRCEVVTSSYETCQISRSKLKTYELLKGVVPVPRVYQNSHEINEADMPVFLKPDVGQGSKGTVLADTRSAVDFYVGQNQDLLVLENLPGKEYTVDCFTDRGGSLLFSAPRERARIGNGISTSSHVVNDDRFSKLAMAINDKLKFNGVWFFQVKESANKELVLMEIAPRVAGTMGLSRARGVNLVLLSLFNASGIPVKIEPNQYDITIDRALANRYEHNIQYKHVYLDFDDLVIVNGRVNPQIMAFVYQCINKDVEIHLITRHTAALDETLKKFKLHNIFNEIIWITDNTEKHKHIRYKDAIFIDDSFAERCNVAKHTGIPVFDAHMVEVLMERF